MESRQYNMEISTNGRWRGSSILWYERASAFTGYHRLLLDYISELLRPEDTVCELACGSGSLSREVSKYVKHVYANEINTEALEYMQEMLSQGTHKNITSLPGDWKEVCTGREFDIVMYSYFGAITTDWDLLKSIAKKYVIAVIPSEKSASQHEHRETYEMATQRLDELNVQYRLIPLTVDFGQPFEDIDEAKAYLNHYYRFSSEQELNSFIDEKIEPISTFFEERIKELGYTENGFYYPKIKNIGILIADIRSIK